MYGAATTLTISDFALPASTAELRFIGSAQATIRGTNTRIQGMLYGPGTVNLTGAVSGALFVDGGTTLTGAWTNNGGGSIACSSCAAGIGTTFDTLVFSMPNPFAGLAITCPVVIPALIDWKGILYVVNGAGNCVLPNATADHGASVIMISTGLAGAITYNGAFTVSSLSVVSGQQLTLTAGSSGVLALSSVGTVAGHLRLESGALRGALSLSSTGTVSATGTTFVNGFAFAGSAGTVRLNHGTQFNGTATFAAGLVACTSATARTSIRICVVAYSCVCVDVSDGPPAGSTLSFRQATIDFPNLAWNGTLDVNLSSITIRLSDPSAASLVRVAGASTVFALGTTGVARGNIQAVLAVPSVTVNSTIRAGTTLTVTGK